MKRRSRWVWLAALGGAVVVGLLAAIGVIFSAGLPTGAIVVPRDFPTLEEALKSVSVGGTIVLRRDPEAYQGPFLLDVPGLALLGTRGVVLTGTDGEPAVTVEADGVTIRGVEIAAVGVGLRVEGMECRVEDVGVRSDSIGVQLAGARRSVLERLELIGGRVGVELISSGGNRLVDLTIAGATEAGLRLLQSRENVCEWFSVSGADVGLSLDQDSSGNLLQAGSISDAAECAIRIHASSNNVLSDCRVEDAGIGLVLEAVTGNTVRRCTVERLATVGISLRQSAQNRIEDCEILEAGEVGLLLTQSVENTIAHCTIEGSDGEAIDLESSDRNLILGARVERNEIGISIDGSNNRIMRNHVTDSGLVGVLVTGGRENRLLDNEVRGGEFGIMIVESIGGVVLRNRLADQTACSVAVVNGSRNGVVAENRIDESAVGLLVDGVGRTDFLNNELFGNATGLLLLPSSAGVWIEGNVFRRSGIGLRSVEVDEEIAADLSAVGVGAYAIEESSPAVIVNNSFSGSGVADLVNHASSTLFAGGNWWNGEPGGAVVAGDVRLEESGWRGTVAVGTGEGTAHLLLGRILQYVLESARYRVIDLIGLGSTARAAEALRARDVDLIWWGTGSDLEAILEETGAVAVSIPVVEGWTVIASSGIAERLPSMTLSSLAAVVDETGEKLRIAVLEALGERNLSGFLVTYGLAESIAGITWAETMSETETMAKLGAVDLAIVRNLEETLTFSGFTPMVDDLEAFDSEHLAVVLQDELRARHPDVERIVRSGLTELTTEEIHSMISRVRLLDRDPADVALEFVEGMGSGE